MLIVDKPPEVIDGGFERPLSNNVLAQALVALQGRDGGGHVSLT